MAMAALPLFFLSCALFTVESASNWKQLDPDRLVRGEGLVWSTEGSMSYVYGGDLGEGTAPRFAGLRKYNFSSDSWAAAPVESGSKPEDRGSAASAIDSSGGVYVYGGFGGNTPSVRKDAWYYNSNSKTWKSLPDHNYALRESVGFVRKDSFFVMGGLGNTDINGDTSRVWQYHPGKDEWREVQVGKQAPDARFSHSGVYVPASRRRALEGTPPGSSASLRGQAAAEAASPSAASRMFEAIDLQPQSADVQVHRSAHASSAATPVSNSISMSSSGSLPTDCFYVVAGRSLVESGSFKMLSDVWRLNFTSEEDGWVTGEWERVPVTGFPLHRAYHATTYYGGALWVTGGYLAISQGAQVVYYVFNDLLKFVPTGNNGWKTAVTEAAPPVRYNHGMTIRNNGELFITAGIFNFLRNDAWKIQLDGVDLRDATEEDLYVITDSDPFITSAIFIVSIAALFVVCLCVFLISMRQVVIRRRRRRMRMELEGIVTENQHARGTPQHVIDALSVIPFTSTVKEEVPPVTAPGVVPEGEKENEDARESCAVCLVEYENGEEVKVLPCAHIFHVPCIETWLRGHKTCPLCKHDVEQPPPNPERLRSILGSTKTEAH